jgi:hypothetical protein
MLVLISDQCFASKKPSALIAAIFFFAFASAGAITKRISKPHGRLPSNARDVSINDWLR